MSVKETFCGYVEKLYDEVSSFIGEEFPEVGGKRYRVEVRETRGIRGCAAGNDKESESIKFYVSRNIGDDLHDDKVIYNDGVGVYMRLKPSVFMSLLHEIVELTTGSHEAAILYEIEALKRLIKCDRYEKYKPDFERRMHAGMEEGGCDV